MLDRHNTAQLIQPDVRKSVFGIAMKSFEILKAKLFIGFSVSGVFTLRCGYRDLLSSVIARRKMRRQLFKEHNFKFKTKHKQRFFPKYGTKPSIKQSHSPPARLETPIGWPFCL